MSVLDRVRDWLLGVGSASETGDEAAPVRTLETGEIHVDEHEVYDAEALKLVDRILEEVRN